MCGIVGYIGSRDAIGVLVSGLKRLEYRGYDSAGIALNCESESSFQLFKAKGKVSNLESIIPDEVKMRDNMPVAGIGHTRWATHGEPSTANAHPHLSMSGEVVLVHNGIIENYKELKDQLIDRGYTFQSQTDTEVLCNLVDLYYQQNGKNLRLAVVQALNKAIGAYAIAVMEQKDNQHIVCARKASPLVIGISEGNDEFFIGSDATPMVEYTHKVIYLDDEQVAEGLTINHTLLAGEYTLKVVATTTMGKETSRTSLVQVRPLEGDPNPGNDIRDRQVVPGSVVKLHGTNMDKVTKISFGGKEAVTTFVDKGDKSYVEYTVPADLALGTYRVTLYDAAGNVYGGNKIVVSNEAPEVLEETLWEGSFNVTWGTPFDQLKDQFPNLVKAGKIVRAYVNGNGQGAMTTAWWNNILTGKGDPERGDIMISGSAVLEYELTDYSMQLMNEQNGALFVGDGYTITKVTVEQ